MVIVNFIRDPNVGIFARAKRVPVGSSTVSVSGGSGGGFGGVSGKKVNVGGEGGNGGEESDKSE
ncbi:MAG: hypothetical protein O7C59_07290 [Rickettsia endosymbiont of Ixodes persulcatus]|nr:hypothetical protein [Rickettsia endosymbiont of Ixodes persulcatus]